jgi:superfamily II DNA/RNA helicase
MSQPQREKVTADFRNKKINILIATDVAARGLHIEDITHVYNFEIPRDVESYTHRVGRTARAGKKGEAVSFVATDDEKKFFKQILFTYSGSITMKKLDGIELPEPVQEVAQPKQQQPQQRKERPEPRPEKQREQRRPHQKPEKQFKRKESGGRGRNTRQGDKRKPSQKEFRREPRGERQTRESKIWFGKREEESSSLRSYKKAAGESSNRRNDNRNMSRGYSSRGSYNNRRDFNQPPRKRSEFKKEETYQTRTEDFTPQDEKKKKRNWKEMWQRLVGE